MVSLQSQRKVLKNITRKNVTPNQTSALLSQSTVEKDFVVHGGALLNFLFCYSPHDHWQNTTSFVALVAFTQTVLPAKWLRPGDSKLRFRHNPRPPCGPVSFTLLCMYNTTAWHCFYYLKFDILRAVVFSACWSCACGTHWWISSCPMTPRRKTDFKFSDFYLCVSLH